MFPGDKASMIHRLVSLNEFFAILDCNDVNKQQYTYLIFAITMYIKLINECTSKQINNIYWYQNKLTNLTKMIQTV